MPPKKGPAPSTSKVKVDKVVYILSERVDGPDPGLLLVDLWHEKRASPRILCICYTDPIPQKKGAKTQKEVQRIQTQSAQAGKSRDVLEKEKEKALREKAKLEEDKRRKEEAEFFKPIQTQKVPFGVDPKTILCAFFKAGNCEKGNKCKFSHNRDVERKTDKKNLYEDARDDKDEGALFAIYMIILC